MTMRNIYAYYVKKNNENIKNLLSIRVQYIARHR